jgi:hypothetical protein
LNGVAADESVIAAVTDQDGREVVLLTRVWEVKITRDRSELSGHLRAILEAVAHPDHVEPDAVPTRTRSRRAGCIADHNARA